MSIAKEWARYRELNVPAEASAPLVGLLYRAFYSGALALSGLIISEVSGDKSGATTPDDDETIDALLEELRQFCDQRGD